MKKKAVFFDAGETLVYRNPSLLEITRRFLKKAGINIDKKILGNVLNYCAIKMKPMVKSGKVSDSRKWKIYIAMVLKKLKIKNKKLLFDLKERLKKGTSFRAFPEIKRILKRLRNLGFKLSVISNAPPELDEILKRTGIHNFFDSIIISENVGYEKPDIMIFKKALNALKVKPEETIYVGDNYITDIKGAIKAGITPVWLRRKSKNNEFSYSGKKDKNVFKIKKVSEIIELIKKEGWN